MPHDALTAPNPALTTEEHELPCLEAVLAGTLALMTGYSQALQAELHPAQRLAMGEKIGGNLSLLANHPTLSAGFRQVMLGLQRRWHTMGECTAAAACEAQRHPAAAASSLTLQVAAPTRLQ